MDKYFAFQWHITDECDQRCQHCYIFAEDNNIPLIEMNYEKIEAVFGNCMDMCRKLEGIPYFYITGGDPILHKDFWKMLELFKANNIAFGILGNPFHLTEEVCKKLKYYGCDKYQLSIDGLRETHDKIRKSGSFDTTIEKISVLRNAGIKCAIMTTVSKMNIDEIEGIIDVVVENNVNIFAFARYCPTGFEKSNHIEPNEYKDFLEKIWNKFEQYKDSNTSFNLKDHLWTLFLHEKGLFEIPEDLDKNTIYDGCNCANSHMTILPTGNVYACRRMESQIGNVFKESIHNIFLGEKMDKYREYNKFEKCSKCELLRFCRGCPAVAYGYTGNSYAPDPQCWKEV